MQTFDFKKVSTIVDGNFIVGFMDGTGIAAEKNEDNITPHVGADGGVTYAESNDNTGTITLTLRQNSPSLSALIKLSQSKKTFPAQIIDSNDNKMKAGGNHCRILKTPSAEWGSEISGVEVQIYVADYKVSAV